MKHSIYKLSKVFFYCLLCLLFANISSAQQKSNTNKYYTLAIVYKDTALEVEPIAIKKQYNSLAELNETVYDLPKKYIFKGYATASMDSIWQIADTTFIHFYHGPKFNWVQLTTSNIQNSFLNKVNFDLTDYTNKPLNFNEINILKEKLLKVYENEGYPFATIFLDSINIIDNKMYAVLKAKDADVYLIDSINLIGNLKLKTKFLQRYLNIKNGSRYAKEKLEEVDRKILELPFAEPTQPSYLDMVATGATLKVHANSKKSSEASAIIGFLPDANNTGKSQITGDVNFDLKNLFGSGEGLLFKYQALQPKSPRLNIGFEKPYLFQSPYGINFLADFFKKDSSFFQINAQVGAQLNLTTYQQGKLFIQFQSTRLLQEGIDTNFIINQKQLPNIIDVSATNVGLNYEYRKTNYRYNPISGSELNITTLVGIKQIEKNNDIVKLSSGGVNFASLYDSLKLKSYQLRLKITAAHYFKLAKTSTLKASLNLGIYNSPNIFRNEVFQIGGYKLLRGFDEESIYATQYAVTTAEFRSLLSLNSYIFSFIDFGLTQTKFLNTNTNNNFISTGLGMVYETKAGLLNISLAIGKRNDLPFNLRQAAKIHFGYINYF
jgi:outer membrane protein assembly factor BamA